MSSKCDSQFNNFAPISQQEQFNSFAPISEQEVEEHFNGGAAIGFSSEMKSRAPQLFPSRQESVRQSLPVMEFFAEPQQQPPSRPFQQQRPIDPSLTLRDPVMTDFLRLAPNPTPPAASPTRSPARSPTRSPGSQRGLPASPTSPTKRP